MYSPKICEDLIPRIYRAAKAANVPMTAWVNQAVERALPEAATNQQNLQPRNLPSPAANAVDSTGGRSSGKMEGGNGEH